MKYWLPMSFRRLTSMATVVMLSVAAMIAVVSAAGTPAYANMPNEEGSYTHEVYGNGAWLQAYGTVAEARNADGAALRMWRGVDNWTIWASYGGGNPYVVQNGRSPSEPSIVPHGNGFAAFHTGTDGRIYWSRGDGTPNGWQPWQALPFGTVVGSVAATQVGRRADRSTSIYIGYRGAGGTQLFGAYFDGNTYTWGNEQYMSGGQSYSHPSLAWDQRTNQIRAAVRGTDTYVWVATQNYGSPNWSGWSRVAGSPSILDTPTIAVDDNGYRMIGAVADNGHIVYARYDPFAGAWHGWDVDITNWRSIYSISIQILGTIFYTIMTGVDDNVYFKRNFRY